MAMLMCFPKSSPFHPPCGGMEERGAKAPPTPGPPEAHSQWRLEMLGMKLVVLVPPHTQLCFSCARVQPCPEHGCTGHPGCHGWPSWDNPVVGPHPMSTLMQPLGTGTGHTLETRLVVFLPWLGGCPSAGQLSLRCGLRRDQPHSLSPLTRLSSSTAIWCKYDIHSWLWLLHCAGGRSLEETPSPLPGAGSAAEWV